MKRLLLCLLLVGCARHPSPGPAVEKVNGAHTANADDAVVRGEDYGSNWHTTVHTVRMPIVYFDFDSDQMLQEYGDSLSFRVPKKGNWVCNVDGHASEEGTEDYNLALGQRRAYRVGSYLADFRGIQVHETSYGEEKPASTNQVLNRRVEVVCE